MLPDDIDYPPLRNLMRGVRQDDREPTDSELRAALAERGLDTDRVAADIAARISAVRQQRRSLRRGSERKWQNQSVRLFAQGEDPVRKMRSLAADLALTALEGVSAPTAVDPFKLAELRRIPVVPNAAIVDARLIPIGIDRFRIEYNPNQPKSRTRFSIAHELAHTFFEDCGEAIRNRESKERFASDDWELEMLCNIGAAELLMPVASFSEFRTGDLNIEAVLDLRGKIGVSAEALLLRVAEVTSESSVVFAASRAGDLSTRYRVDYAVASRAWTRIAPKGLLPKKTVVAECTAIGFTAKGEESWPDVGAVHVECVGVPPYRGAVFPRVIGILTSPQTPSVAAPRIVYVRGDATEPRGSGCRIVAHNINDKAMSWGFGFAGRVARKWPKAEAAFKQRVLADKSALRLGSIFRTEVEADLWTFQMVCQRGYGPGSAKRIRYGALKECLGQLAAFASEQAASVHLPRLGTGYGGASWSIVSEIIDETVCRAGIPVTVYDLPNAKADVAPDLPNLFAVKR